jgi:hypothetical protein
MKWYMRDFTVGEYPSPRAEAAPDKAMPTEAVSALPSPPVAFAVDTLRYGVPR